MTNDVNARCGSLLCCAKALMTYTLVLTDMMSFTPYLGGAVNGIAS